MINEALLKKEERAVFALRSLYRQYGYLPFKMSKFEEYDLYLSNKDFLVSDRIITFNDTDGRLLALKPDVTISIIKSGRDQAGCKQKVCYDENVYRVSGRSGQFKEIMQTGLECIGDIDIYDIFEALLLAAKTLSTVSDEYVLNVSHLGILNALLQDIGQDQEFARQATALISAKNLHELTALCQARGVGADKSGRLCALVSLYGGMDEVTGELRTLCGGIAGAEEPLAQLTRLSEMLAGTDVSDRIVLDFSVVNDMNYYNGVVFKGFLSGIFEGVLAGGQYDKLLRRMGRKAGAIGFALYLDLLDQIDGDGDGYDVDCLLLYDAETPADQVAAKVRELTGAGLSVTAQRAVPDRLRYRQTVDMRGGAAC